MTPRLYITAALETDTAAPLSQAQAHYLKNVLRRGEGDEVRLFNGRDGEFAGEIVALKKKAGLVAVKAQTRMQETGPDLTLCFAPVKRGPLEVIIQKATEIGVARFLPVITERTTAPKINRGRLEAIAIEAAEQCGRMDVPMVAAPVKLERLLDDWPTEQQLAFCDEAGDDEDAEWGGRHGRAAPALEALKTTNSKTHKGAVLTGPEGGFSFAERKRIRAMAFVTPITLGPRILRADTAALAALVLWQAALGDWRRP